jgi:hypothetical protein
LLAAGRRGLGFRNVPVFEGLFALQDGVRLFGQLQPAIALDIDGQIARGNSLANEGGPEILRAFLPGSIDWQRIVAARENFLRSRATQLSSIWASFVPSIRVGGSIQISQLPQACVLSPK